MVTVASDNSSCVVVPQGWQRELEGSTIYYLSPDNHRLNNVEEVVQHLVTPGTCKCGLRCPVDVKKVFSFDPNQIPLPDHNENIPSIHSHCKQKIPRFRTSVSDISDIEPLKSTNDSEVTLSLSKSVGSKRTMSFALLPDAVLAKKVKTVRHSASTSPKKAELTLGKSSSTNTMAKRLIQPKEVSQNLVSLLKIAKTNLTINIPKVSTEANLTIPSKPSNSQSVEAPVKSTIPAPSTSTVASTAPGKPAETMRGYSSVQEILKQVKKLSFSKEGKQVSTEHTPSTTSVSPMKVECPLPIVGQNQSELCEPEKAVSDIESSPQLQSMLNESTETNKVTQADTKSEQPATSINKNSELVFEESESKVQKQLSSVFESNNHETCVGDNKNHDFEQQDSTLAAPLSSIVNDTLQQIDNPSDNLSSSLQDTSSSQANVQTSFNTAKGTDCEPQLALATKADENAIKPLTCSLEYALKNLKHSVPMDISDLAHPNINNNSSHPLHVPSTKVIPSVAEVLSSSAEPSAEPSAANVVLSLPERVPSFPELAPSVAKVPSATKILSSTPTSVAKMVPSTTEGVLSSGAELAPSLPSDVNSQEDELGSLLKQFFSNSSSNDNTELPLDGNIGIKNHTQNGNGLNYISHSSSVTKLEMNNLVSVEPTSHDFNITEPDLKQVSDTQFSEDMLPSSLDLSQMVENAMKFSEHHSPNLLKPLANHNINERSENCHSSPGIKSIFFPEPHSTDGYADGNLSQNNDKCAPNECTSAPCTELKSESAQAVLDSSTHDVPEESSVHDEESFPNSLPEHSSCADSEGHSQTSSAAHKVFTQSVETDNDSNSDESTQHLKEDASNQASANSSLSIASPNIQSAIATKDESNYEEDTGSELKDPLTSPISIKETADEAFSTCKDNLPHKIHQIKSPSTTLEETTREHNAVVLALPEELSSPPVHTLEASCDRAPDSVSGSPSAQLPDNTLAQDATISETPLTQLSTEKQNDTEFELNGSSVQERTRSEPPETHKSEQEIERPLDMKSIEQESSQPVDTQFEEQETGQPVSTQSEEQETEQPMDTKSEIQETEQPMDTKSEIQETEQPMDTKSEIQETEQPMDTKSEIQETEQPMDTKSDIQETGQPIDRQSEEQGTGQPIGTKSEIQETEQPMDTLSEKQDDLKSAPPPETLGELVETKSNIESSEQLCDAKPEIQETKQPMDTITVKQKSEKLDDMKLPLEVPALDAVVEQCIEDDQQSGSAIITSSAQCRSGTPYSIPLSSPSISTSETNDDGSNSALSASHSSTLSLLSAISSVSDTNKSKINSEMLSKDVDMTKAHTQSSNTVPNTCTGKTDISNSATNSLETSTSSTSLESNISGTKVAAPPPNEEACIDYSKWSKSDFRKFYPIRSKLRPASERVRYSPTTRNTVSKRARSTSYDLKSPLSESSSVCDSVFEGERLSATKKRKRNRSKGHSSHSLTVSIPRSSTDLTTVVASCQAVLPFHSTMKLKVGDVVWAKAPQLPGWPGRIMSHKERIGMEQPPKTKVWVEWFGGSTMSMVDITAVKPLEDGIKQRMQKQKKLPKKLEIAIKQARGAVNQTKL